MPEMIGNVKSSSGDPRSRRNINISANLSVNQRRNLPSASATSFLTRLAATEMTNKPNKPPAPILVGWPPVACLTLPCHAEVMSRSPLRMGAMKPQHPRATAAVVAVAAVKPVRNLQGVRDIGREASREFTGVRTIKVTSDWCCDARPGKTEDDAVRVQIWNKT